MELLIGSQSMQHGVEVQTISLKVWTKKYYLLTLYPYSLPKLVAGRFRVEESKEPSGLGHQATLYKAPNISKAFWCPEQ